MYVPTGYRVIESAGLIVERGVAIVHNFEEPYIDVGLGEHLRIAFLAPNGEEELGIASYER